MIAYFSSLTSTLMMAIAHKLEYNHDEKCVLFIQDSVFKTMQYLVDGLKEEGIFTDVVAANLRAPCDIPDNPPDDVAEKTIIDYFDNFFAEISYSPIDFDTIFVLNDNHDADYTIYFNIKQIKYAWVQYSKNQVGYVHPTLNKCYKQLHKKYKSLGPYAEYAYPWFRNASENIPLQQFSDKPHDVWDVLSCFNNISDEDLQKLFRCNHLDEIDFHYDGTADTTLIIQNSYGFLSERIMGNSQKKNTISLYLGFGNYSRTAIFSLMDKISLDFYAPETKKVYLKCHINWKIDQETTNKFYGENAIVLPNVYFQILSRYFAQKSIKFTNIIGIASTSLDESIKAICEKEYLLGREFAQTWWFYISLYTTMLFAQSQGIKYIYSSPAINSQIKLLSQKVGYDIEVLEIKADDIIRVKGSMVIIDLCNYNGIDFEKTDKTNIIAFINDTLSTTFIKSSLYERFVPICIKKDRLSKQPYDTLLHDETVWIYSANADIRNAARSFTFDKELKHTGIRIYVDNIALPAAFDMFKAKQAIYESELLKAKIQSMEKKLDNLSQILVKSDSAKSILRSISAMDEYLDMLNMVKGKYIIMLTVKDTPGSKMPESVFNKLKTMGFTEFEKKRWHMYVGFIGKKATICNISASATEEPVTFSCIDANEGVCFELASYAWRKGNQASIIIDGNDYAVNIRGINIVVYDIDKKEVIDSVGFDAHVKADGTFMRKTF